ncbi:MAG: flagellar hook-basal body complex protein FliE [Dehalococcoidia bacterium]|nr:MAG: flagellar hook-basal body complex protein FliE [bacterium]MCE7929024.1 flagellar hook-basal body complex protein FliE [Chloroflexi bacterium CFX7]MCL4230447.1 flagellar hook-basal body complex protein FliE [Dehalococcoidia bacterium]NUQ54490.1 flagellar hook-basal body complex protein FliE [Dehalococcoidia bacterium]
MEIERIQAAAAAAHTGVTGAKPAAGFADMLGKALDQLQSVSDTANQKVTAMATGQDVELHDVMLALEAESLAMSLATQVRNKAVEAYQEVFRMQV